MTHTTVYRRARRRADRRNGRTLWCAAALAAIMLAVWCAATIDKGIREPLRALATEKVTAVANQALTCAVLNVLERYQYSSAELLSVAQRDDGSYLILADTAQIARITAEISAEAQSLIEQMSANGVDIPFGTVSGVALLTGVGPNISVGFTPVGSVGNKYVSTLHSSGINQSLFSINLTLTASVRLILSDSADVITVSSVTPICETVVVGSVPQVYTNVANEEDMLNLIPTDVP